MTENERDTRPLAKYLNKDGDLDMTYLDNLNYRLLQIIEHDIEVLEAPEKVDLFAEFGKKLDLLEKALKVRRLMHLPRQRRAKQKKRRRRSSR